jgi:beta-galactosidase/beta-glucuronidase
MSVKDMASQIINGQWKINFGTENSTATEAFSVETDKLLSWDKLTDARARKFTGTAHYETTFTVDSKLLKRNRRVYLDLGSVNVMAGITVNGKTLETLWMPPFRADITELLKKGQNKLRVEITSTSPCESPGLLGPVRLINFTRKELF